MESVGVATGREVPLGVLQRVHSRAEWAPWALGAAIVIGAALRFSTLGLAGYHHDEAWTAGYVLHSSLFKTIDKVVSTESTPPLYFVLAWGWSKLFGTGEWGLRSLSAIFGLATIPVAYLIGRRMSGSGAAVAAAAIAAVNPALIWYSQEARAYALMILLSALAFYFFLRARDGLATRDLVWWAAFSVLAVWTHYFAAMPAVVEAAFLIAWAGKGRRAAVTSVAALAAGGLAVLPLAIHQGSAGHANWIVRIHFSERLKETAVTFVSGETGHVIDQPLHSNYAWVPLALLAVGLVLLIRRATASEKRMAVIAIVVAAGVFILAFLAAVVGEDFVLARNLLPALIPLLAAAAVGFGCRGAGRLGAAACAGLVVYWFAFAIYVDLRPRLQRPDWRGVAEFLDRSSGSREIVTSGQGAVPLRFYLDGPSFQLQSPVPPMPVREVDVVSVGAPPKQPTTGLPAPFHPAGQVTENTVILTRYRALRPVPVPWHPLIDHYTGFHSRNVIAQGPGAHAAANRSQ